MLPARLRYRSALASVWRDIFIAVVVALACGWLAVRFEIQEALFAWSRRFEYVQLDEWPVAVFAFAACLLLLYAVRYRQLRGALAENRRLARQALATQEEERRHLAREMHDELGQYLNAIQLDARGLGGGDSAQAEAAARIGENAAHVYGVVSDLVRRLRPSALDELGLLAALEACIDRARALHPGISISLSCAGEWEGLGEAVNLAIYRIVQESLTNCVRHARSSSMQIVMRRSPTSPQLLELEIADHGVGMDARKALAAGGGLAGMRERALLQGGSFELLSHPGLGATIRVVLPLDGDSRREP